MAYSAKDFIRNPLSLKASVIWNLLWTMAVLAALTAMLILWAATPAKAHNGFSNCGQMQSVVKRLRDRYGETIQMILPNLSQPNPNGQTILTANIETGTWTMVVTGPDYPDLMCVIQSGNTYNPDLFQIVPPDENFQPEAEGDDI